MKPNIGNTDRIIRFVVGAILLLIGALVPMSSAALQVILVLLGAVLLVTAALRFCPLYMPFKFNTLKK